MAVADGVVADIVPFLIVAFAAAELAVPEMAIPEEGVGSEEEMPLAGDGAFPKADPRFEGCLVVGGGGAEEMEVVGEEDIAAYDPTGGVGPRLPEQVVERFVGEEGLAAAAADGDEENNGVPCPASEGKVDGVAASGVVHERKGGGR
jgi:hypothetical protein